MIFFSSLVQEPWEGLEICWSLLKEKMCFASIPAKMGGGGMHHGPCTPGSDGPFVVSRPRSRPQEENEKTQFKFTLCYRRRAPLFKQVSTHWINE
jgi:hypothetical protein